MIFTVLRLTNKPSEVYCILADDKESQIDFTLKYLYADYKYLLNIIASLTETYKKLHFMTFQINWNDDFNKFN